MPETSIVFKANDQISGSMKSILGNSQALNKQFEVLQQRVGQLSQKNDAFNKSFSQVSAQALEARKALKEAETAFKKTGDEESRLNFENAKKQYKDLTDAAKSYEDASRDTRKSIRETQEEIRKLGANPGGSGVPAEGGGFLSGIFGSGLGAGLAQSGIIRDLGNSLSGIAGTLIESAVGQPVATALSETLSSTVSSVAAGAIAGVPGMIAGGAIGAFAGALNAGNQIFQQKDEAFKDYVQESTEGQLAQRDADIQSGSAVAGRGTRAA